MNITLQVTLWMRAKSPLRPSGLNIMPECAWQQIAFLVDIFDANTRHEATAP
jgi:hypothetical protein